MYHYAARTSLSMLASAIPTSPLGIVYVGWLVLSAGLGFAQSPAAPREYMGAQSEIAAVLPHQEFRIPFNVRGTQQGISAVQLWVSDDGGKTWNLQATVPPTARGFDYVAPRDGVFQFTVRTVDAHGTAYPSSDPPLIVAVDRGEPVVNLSAEVDDTAQLVIDVRALDPTLDPTTATLRVRGSGSDRWQEVAIRLVPERAGNYHGRATVALPPGREIAIAFSVQDRAQHSGSASLIVGVPRTAEHGRGMRLASSPDRFMDESRIPELPGAVAWKPAQDSGEASVGRQAMSRRGSNEGARARPGPYHDTGQPDLGRLASGSELSLNPPSSRSWESLSQGPDPTHAPPPSRSRPVLQGTSIEELPPPPGVTTKVAPEATAQPRSEALLEDNARSAPLDLLPLAPQGDDRPIYASTPMDQSLPKEQSGLQFDPPQASSAASGPATPPGSIPETAFHSRSMLFSLDYDVADLRGSSLSSIELWGTEDGGATWQKWGTDEDRQSPFDVQVGNDGLFGFRMVVVSANGLVSNRPHPGDDADMWVFVDTQPPQARIYRAVYGQRDDADKLLIDYDSRDGHLTPRPVSLYYSEMREGPWQVIATGLPPSGQYAWKVPAEAPAAVYLKIEAADKAGNIASALLEVPVELTRLVPKGRIRGFRPVLDPQ
ncbi:MAG: hypothetical protein D6753_00135 [Planctomycetota bacterium]|nr:MAG: hypothetical protein D6753_00135 [Planctomycetota bacterium]